MIGTYRRFLGVVGVLYMDYEYLHYHCVQGALNLQLWFVTFGASGLEG